MEKLGIQPMLLLAQMVNFAIVVVVLQKLLYKPILDILEKRKKHIAEGVALTDKLRKDDEKQASNRDKALAKAREDALEIINEAKKSAKDVQKEALDEAHEQAGAIITRAKQDAKELQKEAQGEVRKQAIDLSVVMAKRLLEGVLSDKDQHLLIAKHLKELQKTSL